MDNKGFTLVEVLAVIAILAIIGTITAPNILNTLNTGKKSSDNILYENIRTALENMYEEKYYSGSKVYIYSLSGNTGGEVSFVGDTMTSNIQTLVGNGFLTGVNNSDKSENSNSKIVLNSENKDIGMCELKITKVKNGNKICYKVEKKSGENFCPTTKDFGGDNQCS